MKVRDDGWQRVWGFWVAYFGAAEYLAIKSGNPKAPLSYFLRASFGTRHKHPLTRKAGQMALGAAVVWLIAHLYENQE